MKTLRISRNKSNACALVGYYMIMYNGDNSALGLLFKVKTNGWIR